jgi:hypothetical protein
MGQTVQLALPSMEVLPIGHGEHEVESFDAENDPAGHRLHEVELFRAVNVPAGQTEQVLLETAEPMGQTVQFVLPSMDVVPAGHGEHIAAPESEKVPAGQEPHAMELAFSLNVPARHTEQVLF